MQHLELQLLKYDKSSVGFYSFCLFLAKATYAECLCLVLHSGITHGGTFGPACVPEIKLTLDM